MFTWRRVTVIIVVALAIVVAVPTMSDLAYANALHISVRITPPILPGDGQTAALITLQYRDGNGKPRVGDILNLVDLSRNAGTIARYSTQATNGFAVIAIYRIVTDRQGQAIFRYIAAAANPFEKTLPAHIQVTDTSLGTVLEIDRTTQLTINVVDPSKLKGGSSGTHS